MLAIVKHSTISLFEKRAENGAVGGVYLNVCAKRISNVMIFDTGK